MTTSNVITIEELRVQRDLNENEQSNYSHQKTQDKFLLGPFSLNWLSKAAKLPGRTLHYAIVLAHISRLTSSDIVMPSPTLLRDFGINRYSGYRAISALENAHLIVVVDRIRGRCPRIKLLGLKAKGARW